MFINKILFSRNWYQLPEVQEVRVIERWLYVDRVWTKLTTRLIVTDKVTVIISLENWPTLAYNPIFLRKLQIHFHLSQAETWLKLLLHFVLNIRLHQITVYIRGNLFCTISNEVKFDKTFEASAPRKLDRIKSNWIRYYWWSRFYWVVGQLYIWRSWIEFIS